MHESTPPKQIMLHERQGWASSRCVTPKLSYCDYHLSFPIVLLYHTQEIFTRACHRNNLFLSSQEGNTVIDSCGILGSI